MARQTARSAEGRRLDEDQQRAKNWKRWGPYLAERQWGTVREDYSADGSCWEYFPHDHARSRAYRWGEDGLLGICDREGRLCFALALWNEHDPILKERLFGLGNPEGNHGEDVKEEYFYLDSTPTHSYMRALYKYPQVEFPYALLLEENARRSRHEPEFELADTGVFDEQRYFDVVAEYAKADADDILVRITVANRGPQAAPLHVLPTLWFRNTWSWGRHGEGYWPKPTIAWARETRLRAEHTSLGVWHLDATSGPSGLPTWLLTDNDTNAARLFGHPNPARYVKDAFHDYIVHGSPGAVNPAQVGTKAAAHYHVTVPAGGEVALSLRLHAAGSTPDALAPDAAARLLAQRRHEADELYDRVIPADWPADARHVARQAYAGLLWTKQFFHYDVGAWLEGDPSQPQPPSGRAEARNADWKHLYNRDVLSMPDKWEYPWYAAWDLAFHTLPFAHVDPAFSKEQLVLLLREWYMHPNGQIPAYEFAFSDVNPPVHAWACWRVYKLAAPRGGRDRLFLSRVVQRLLVNFTWWVNRKDVRGRHLFSGGFLGLDNIGVFDRSRPLPSGGFLEQADGTAWMAVYCATLLAMALELAQEDPACEDSASKFFEHFVAIADATNTLGGHGLWDEQDGFYYDQLHVDGGQIPLRVRSLVGLIPLCAVEVLDQDQLDRVPGFTKRLHWFIENRKDLRRHISYAESGPRYRRGARLLAIPSRERLERVLRYMLDEDEFLSPYGIRSLSRVHLENPYVLADGSGEYRVQYQPGESDTALFGGNSNWRGPVWFPINYLLIEALERYSHFYGDTLLVECPTGSGRWLTLAEVARELATRLTRLFLPDADGRRPCFGDDVRFAADPHWRDLLLFHEYFHGDTGRGLGASHQTGWTALVTRLLGKAAR